MRENVERYVFYINQFKIIDDDHVEETNIAFCGGLNFLSALKMLEEFVIEHPDGHLNNNCGYIVEYETDDTELSAFIEMEDS